MIKEFIPYEEALELKALGFDEPCFGVYINNKLTIEDEWFYATNQETFIESDNFTAPTFSQAFRWFREKHNLPNHIHTMWQNDWNDYSYQWHITEDKKEWNCIEHFKTYEEAELACLRKLIELVKND